ncbi:MAG: hypothetical protein OEZ15_08705 [Gammaproteobacteria bacterium]|nr:hypothetical protein [Gammaproteobacteria bacterium]
MLKLPSGRVIDLSTDRSRYHALQQKGIAAKAHHRKLYALVDVVYRKIDSDGCVNRGWTEYDYSFSGYTLDSVRYAEDWGDADKTALLRWAGLPDQCRRIETARRRLSENQPQLSVKNYSSPENLYSLLQRRLQQLPMTSASAEQWLATIENLKQKGVREEEIQWSGLRQFLQQQCAGQQISKKQLLEKRQRNLRLELSIQQIWGEDGGLSFKELVQRMPHQAVYRAALKLDQHCLCLMRYLDRASNYRVGVVKTLSQNHTMALNKYWFALDPYGRAIRNQKDDGTTSLFFDNSLEAKTAANQHARDHLGIHNGVKNHTQFDHLTLFGGHDYREWFVSLPDYQRVFFGAHFFDHNLLAHIRTTTRTDKSGRKILFIEEVQSDWHQNGKRKGYNNSYWGHIANAPFKNEWPVLAAKLMLIHASQNGFAGIAWSMGSVQEMRYQRYLQPIKQYYDQAIPDALNRLVKPFNCQVESACIQTRDPWLNLEKQQQKWRVADGAGKFKTKAKYNNRDEAMAVIARHCRAIELEVPALFITEALRLQIADRGLPMYGHTLD